MRQNCRLQALSQKMQVAMQSSGHIQILNFQIVQDLQLPGSSFAREIAWSLCNYTTGQKFQARPY
jgi:hypothetical protein